MVVVEENSIQFMAKDYIRQHEAIQEALKQLKMLKEQRSLRDRKVSS